MTIKFAVQENLIPGDSLPQKWDMIRAIGYDGIELRGGAGMSTRLPELIAAARAGVVMPSICVMADRFIGDFDATRRAEALAAMKELCDVAGEIGAKGVVTMAVDLAHLRGALAEGMNVTLGIRPQHLRLVPDGVLRLRPDVVEQLGDIGYLYGQTPAGTPLVAQTTDRIPATPTTEVRLGFDPAAVFVFAADGSRLR